MMTIGWVLMSPLIGLLITWGVINVPWFGFLSSDKEEIKTMFSVIALFVCGIGCMAINWSW